MKNKHTQTVRVVIAEDDEDDRVLLQAALQESSFGHAIAFVENGEQLMDYLRRQGGYTSLQSHALPELILLDLNMPRKGGRETLREIRTDAKLKHIPVIILTTSDQREDVLQSYELGANSYIAKPASFDALVKILNLLNVYWFDVVQLPTQDHNAIG